MEDTPVWGLYEIADALGTSYKYVSLMRIRAHKQRRQDLDAGVSSDHNLFPVEDYIVSHRPLWKPETITSWAKRTGRI